MAQGRDNRNNSSGPRRGKSNAGGPRTGKPSRRPSGGRPSPAGERSNESREGSERTGKSYSGKPNFNKGPRMSRTGRPITGPKQSNKPRVDDGTLRLNRFIANSGFCSRREADTYIQGGTVTVNGKAVTEMGVRVQPTDDVRVAGQRLKPEAMSYLMLNKPQGYSTSKELNPARKTVMQLIQSSGKTTVVPVGKLDRGDMGILLFTNDDALHRRLTEMGNPFPKIYQVQLNKAMDIQDLYRMREGVRVDNHIIKPEEIDMVKGGKKNEVGVRMDSNRNKVVQKMFEALGYEVQRVDRTMYGHLNKKDLPRGRYRSLTEQEVINLKNM